MVLGDWVSWTLASNFMFGGSGSGVAKSRNVRTGATLIAPQTSLPTRSLVSPDGRLAFGAKGIVGLIGPAGTTTLAAGPAVDGDTLGISDRLLFWRENGLVRSYDIPTSP